MELFHKGVGGDNQLTDGSSLFALVIICCFIDEGCC